MNDDKVGSSCCLTMGLVALLAVLTGGGTARADGLELRKGDHVCLVGNALGERMQFMNAWEALLYRRYPQLELVVRNLCFPGDEPFKRDRSLNFGNPDDHLRHGKADVILFFFGMNEAFAGPRGESAYAAALTRLIEETKTKDYGGNGPPRIALISPIAHEDLGDPNLTDGKAHNAELERYTAVMKKVAAATGVAFVDLFTPTKALFDETAEHLTINGVHLNEEGDRRVAPLIDLGLFGAPGAPTGATPEPLKTAIADKNFHWFHRYRAVNGYSIYGTRGSAGSDGTYRNRDVMERERAILDEMCANRDRRIWMIAQGQNVPDVVDDTNTLPFFQPKTNVGIPNDPNIKNGKLGSLNYIPAAEQQKLFKLAPGYEINLFASEEDFPELAKPVALNFDNRGRMWVATMPSYPQWQPKSPMDDKLLILEDNNGDGRADRCKVFAGGLHQPTGFELGLGGAFVAQQPDLLFLEDTDGDDRADRRTRRLMGFDSADSHHGLAAFEWGPDGALYFQEGTFKQSQVETPYGPARLGDAGVWRYEPRTERFGVHASLAFANPWGHVFDRWGQNFISDASPGFHYWAAPISGQMEHPDKHPGGARAAHLDWGGSKVQRQYPTFIEKRVRPTSACEIVSSRNFPPEAQGDFLVTNVIGDLVVLQHKVRDEGSGFRGEESTPLVLCEHGNFRPVDIQFGPDGALYIVDWHNALIGHLQHNLRDPSRDHSHGRIWRVSFKERPLVRPPTIAGAPIPALLNLLNEPEDRARYRVRRELAERKTADVIAALTPWVANVGSGSNRDHKLLEALWVYQTHNIVNLDLLKPLLESSDPRARAAATRVLAEWRDRVPDPLSLLAVRLSDSHPRVRLEAVRACSFITSPRSLELALDVLNYPMDPYLDYTLDETYRWLEGALAPKAALASTDPSPPRATAGAGHEHQHGQPIGPRPRIFLDKGPASVRYQLNRLSSEQLLMVDRSSDDPKYQPVYAALLARPGLAIQDREAALAGLTTLNKTEPVEELLLALGRLDGSKPREGTVVEQLATLVLRQPAEALTRRHDEIRQSMSSPNPAVRAVAFASLIASKQADSAWSKAEATPQGRLDFLAAVRFLPDKSTRAALRDRVLTCLDRPLPTEVRRAAIGALALFPSEQADGFQRAARLVGEPALRAAAVRALEQFPKEFRSVDDSRRIVRALVDHAERTPAAQRTTSDFLDAMHLTDELLSLLSVDEVRGFRDRLRAVTVRLVRINTVHEEMRYDTPYFAVEAGRPVQLVLKNEDLMPHNLVITTPGSLQDVAQLAAVMPPDVDRRGKQYVPRSPKVLFSTKMIDPLRQEALTFDAPKEPGEYPYVCTFPNHWMRMYGVMVVVDDLDAWLASPVKPADPIGGSREFVKNWSVEDFLSDLVASPRGGHQEKGRQVFQEATCLQCHKMKGEGGAVGPELTDVLERWKGDTTGVLREILDPSHKVEPNYVLYNFAMTDGKVLSGIVTAQDADTITVVSDPANPRPRVIPRDDVDELLKTSSSIMPKGLLDRFTREEILDLLTYVTSGVGVSPSPPSGEGRPK